MSRNELLYQVALSRVRGMGVDLAQKLLEVVGSEKEFFDLSAKDLMQLTGGKSKILERDYRNACLAKAEREMEFVEKNNITISYFTDESYPQRLLNACDAPILLFSLGDCDLNAQHIVSIVGTRKSTEYGRRLTDDLLRDLAEAVPGLVTVSGLAYGSDINAHRSSIKHGLPTVAVLACGLNKIYPDAHRADAATIVSNGGCIVSDYTSQDLLHRGNFVARNRIIAGLSDCTIVVESADKGGSLITANIAQSYNRDLFAVPGRVGDEYSKGCNRLIRSNQAMLITCAGDLIDAMRWEHAKPQKTVAELELFPQLSPEEQAIVEVIKQAGDIHVNALASKTGLPVYKVMSHLVELDCRGVILTLPGCRYAMS